jgi:hypothetical protein
MSACHPCDSLSIVWRSVSLYSKPWNSPSAVTICLGISSSYLSQHMVLMSLLYSVTRTHKVSHHTLLSWTLRVFNVVQRGKTGANPPDHRHVRGTTQRHRSPPLGETEPEHGHGCRATCQHKSRPLGEAFPNRGHRCSAMWQYGNLPLKEVESKGSPGTSGHVAKLEPTPWGSGILETVFLMVFVLC